MFILLRGFEHVAHTSVVSNRGVDHRERMDEDADEKGNERSDRRE